MKAADIAAAFMPPYQPPLACTHAGYSMMAGGISPQNFLLLHASMAGEKAAIARRFAIKLAIPARAQRHEAPSLRRQCLPLISDRVLSPIVISLGAY